MRSILFRHSAAGRTYAGWLAGLAIVGLLSAGGANAATKPAATKAKSAAVAPAKGDVAAGKKAYAMRCVTCHGAEGAGGAMGPALSRVYGAKAASGAFPRYSGALKNSGLTWSQSNLEAYLAAPSKLVPGTLMMIAVPTPADRTNLVAYLASLKSAAR